MSDHVCRVCKRTLPREAFPQDATRKSGFRPDCKECHAQQARDRYRKDPSKVKRWVQNWRTNHREQRHETEKAWRRNNYEKALLQSIRTRCMKNEIPFNLTIDDLHIPDCCPVLGIALHQNTDSKKRPPDMPTVDRVDPMLGYVTGNVRIISMRANRLKQDATLDELEALVRYVRTGRGAP